MREKRAVNIRDVAKAAGVSAAAVSYALREPPSPKLSPERRRQILEILEKLHYVPNESMRRLKTKRTNAAVMFFPSGITTNPQQDMNFLNCFLGAQAEFARNGMDLFLAEASETFLEEKRWKRLIGGKLVDGVLFWGLLETDRYPAEVLEYDIPAVSIQSVYGAPLSVTSDDYHAMYQCVERAIESGHRKIAVIPPPETGYSAKECLRGALDALKAHRISPALTTRSRGYSFENGAEGAREILEKVPGTTCAVLFGSHSSRGAMEVLSGAGKRIPEDFSIVGTSRRFPYARLQVSGWEIPAMELGAQSARLLFRAVNGGQDVESLVLPPILHDGNTLYSIKQQP